MKTLFFRQVSKAKGKKITKSGDYFISVELIPSTYTGSGEGESVEIDANSYYPYLTFMRHLIGMFWAFRNILSENI